MGKHCRMGKTVSFCPSNSIKKSCNALLFVTLNLFQGLWERWMKQILKQVSWIMRGCKFCFSFRKSFAFSAFKSTLQLTSFVLRTHSTANPLQNDGLGAFEARRWMKPHCLMGKTASFCPSNPINNGHPELRMARPSLSHPELVSGSFEDVAWIDSETSVLDYAGLQVLFFISKKLCFFCIQINFAADEFRAAHSLCLEIPLCSQSSNFVPLALSLSSARLPDFVRPEFRYRKSASEWRRGGLLGVEHFSFGHPERRMARPLREK